MKIISLKNSDSIDIQTIEQMAGFSFPEEYSRFLNTYNGGLIDEEPPIAIDVLGTDYQVNLTVLFGIDTDIPDFDISFINSIYEEDAPENSMIIGGTDDGGLVFVVNVDGQLPVCYWDRNLSLGISTEDANAYILAESLAEFIKGFGDIEVSKNKINIVEKGDNNMIEKVNYLPLGSVVYLKGATGKLMVTSRGLIVKNGDGEVFFDYAGVAFPEGLTSDQLVYFNHDGIAKVVFEGFRNDEDEIVVNNIHRFLEENPDFEKGDVKNWKN